MNYISCDKHDYIEIACLYQYELLVTLKDANKENIIAKDVFIGKDKMEYLLGKNRHQTEIKIPLINIKTIKALSKNAKFDVVRF